MTNRTLKKIFANLDVSKTEELEDGTIKVWGYASSGAEDSDGETVTSDAMKAALPDYLKWGAVREMHQAKAAGTAIEAEVQEDGKTWFGAHIVDSEAVKKVQTGVYKGFSIGGKVTARDDLNKTIIKGLKLIEVSLVDRPANPEAVLTMYKAEDLSDGKTNTAAEQDGASSGSVDHAIDDLAAKYASGDSISPIDALADLLNKGTITPEKLLELAKSETKPPETETKSDKSAEEVHKSEAVIEKGMWSVQDFAGVLSTLGWICQDAQYEASYEGDNSPVPAQLRAWFIAGVQIFKDMAAEETAELVAELKAKAGEVETLALAAKADDLTKSGAKFSKATKGALGAIHKAAKDACEHLEKLGYEAAEEIEEADKSAAADDLAKVAVSAVDATAVDLKKAAEALGIEVTEGQLYSQVAKAAMEHAMGLAKRVKELEDKPAPGKALLKAISKGGDVVDAGDDTNKVEPVKDHKGDVNDVATLIKAIHSGKV